MERDGNEDEAGWELIETEGFSQLMGPIQARFEGDGVARFRFLTNETHGNRNGFVHGGVLLSLADHSMGRTARQADPERYHATMQLDMQFIKTAEIGALIELRCRVVSARRTVEFIEAEIFDGAELIATARGIWRNFGPRTTGSTPTI